MSRELEIRTVELLGCQPLARADGTVALRLDTDRLGAIAFAVDQPRIDAMRRDLTKLELLLRQSTGHA